MQYGKSEAQLSAYLNSHGDEESKPKKKQGRRSLPLLHQICDAAHYRSLAANVLLVLGD